MDVVKEDMPGGWCDASVRWRQMIPVVNPKRAAGGKEEDKDRVLPIIKNISKGIIQADVSSTF